MNYTATFLTGSTFLSIYGTYHECAIKQSFSLLFFSCCGPIWLISVLFLSYYLFIFSFTFFWRTWRKIMKRMNSEKQEAVFLSFCFLGWQTCMLNMKRGLNLHKTSICHMHTQTHCTPTRFLSVSPLPQYSVVFAWTVILISKITSPSVTYSFSVMYCKQVIQCNSCNSYIT